MENHRNHLENRRLEERYCPAQGRLVPLATNLTGSAAPTPCTHPCDWGREGCLHLARPLEGKGD